MARIIPAAELPSTSANNNKRGIRITMTAEEDSNDEPITKVARTTPSSPHPSSALSFGAAVSSFSSSFPFSFELNPPADAPPPSPSSSSSSRASCASWLALVLDHDQPEWSSAPWGPSWSSSSSTTSTSPSSPPDAVRRQYWQQRQVSTLMAADSDFHARVHGGSPFSPLYRYRSIGSSSYASPSSCSRDHQLSPDGRWLLTRDKLEFRDIRWTASSSSSSSSSSSDRNRDTDKEKEMRDSSVVRIRRRHARRGQSAALCMVSREIHYFTCVSATPPDALRTQLISTATSSSSSSTSEDNKADETSTMSMTMPPFVEPFTAAIIGISTPSSSSSLLSTPMPSFTMPVYEPHPQRHPWNTVYSCTKQSFNVTGYRSVDWVSSLPCTALVTHADCKTEVLTFASRLSSPDREPWEIAIMVPTRIPKDVARIIIDLIDD